MNHISLQAERLDAGSIEVNANVVFGSIVTSAGNIRYDNITGVVTLTEPGRYEFDWRVATELSSATNEAGFVLVSSQGDAVVGNVPIKAGEVAGTAVIEVSSTPVTVELRNSRAATVFYSTVVPVKARLAVIGEAGEVPACGAFHLDPTETGGYIPENTDVVFRQVIGEYHDLGYTPGTNEITILQTGVYRLEFAIEPIYLVSETISVQVNGVDIPLATRVNEVDGEDKDYTIFSFAILSAGDIVSLEIAGGHFLNVTAADLLVNVYILRIA